MKKIFAFVLASIMVLSLVPASVFAAIVKDCPDTHTVNNCAYAFVDKQDATCTQVGYTVYECKACGEQFLDDLVDTLPHNWEDDAAKKKDNKTAACHKDVSKVVVGKRYVKCKDCKTTTCLETAWQTAHKLGAVSGFGCEAKAQCSVCKNYFTGKLDENGHHIPTGTHQYEFTKVVKEPVRVNGETEVGSALYTCKECKNTTYVDIFAPNCRCAEDALKDIYLNKIVPHKDAACEVEGTLAVYECDDCGQLYSYDKNKSTNKYAPIEKIEDAKIDAKKHAPKDNKYPDPVGCATTFECNACKAKITTYAHDKGDKYMEVDEYSEATCVDYGYSLWLCTFCGWNDAKFDPPTGHTEKSFHIDATCANWGYTVTYCVNEKCHLIDAKGQSVVNTPAYKYDIYGASYDVYLTDEDGNKVPVQVVRVERNEIPNASAHDYECIAASPVACGVQGYEVYQCKNCGNFNTKILAPIQHDFDENKSEYIAPSCSQVGYLKNWCNNCKQYVTVTTFPATPGIHNYESVEIHSNCGMPTDPSYYKNGVWYHTWEIYQCTGCTAQIPVHSNPVGSSKVKTTFDSLEEAELYHYGKATLVNGEWVYESKYDNFGKPTAEKPSTCYSNGYALYECGHCGQLVYVTLEKADHPKAALLPTAAKPATCTTAGNIAYNTCYICNSIVLLNGEEQKTVTLADTVLLPHTGDGNNLVEVILKDCAGNKIGSYWKCPTVNNKTTCNKLFTDKTAATPYTGITADKADDCSFTAIVDYKAATCNTNGVVGIEYCATCGKVRITENYIAENGAKKSVTKNSIEEAEAYVLKCINAAKIDILISANNTVTANTIVIPMFDHDYNAETKKYDAIKSTHVEAEDCSKPGYRYNKCALCPFEYLDLYTPASSTNGHANKYGQSLVGDCGYLQGIKAADRVCFYCGKEVEVKHTTLSEDIKVPATCETNGYTYNYCVECGYRDVKPGHVEFKNPDEYHTKKDDKGNFVHGVKVGVDADYAHAGDYYYACDTCGIALDKTVEVKCPGTGLEVILSSDADAYIAGATVKVTVTLDSFKGVDVWGLNIPVVYDPAHFKFVGFEANTDVFGKPEVSETKYNTLTDKGAISANTVYTGVVSIAAAATENVKIKGALDLVTLEFMVITPVANEYPISVVESVKDIKVATVMNPYTGKAEFVSKDYALNFVNEKGVAVENVLYNATEEVLKVNVKGFLNIDGDKAGLVNMSDALALYEYILFEDNYVEADVNCDGAVNLDDLIFLFDIINGKKTIQEHIYSIVK